MINTVSRMTMRCIIERLVQDGVDEYNQPVMVKQDQPEIRCFAWSKSKKTSFNDNRTAFIQDLRMMVESSSEVLDTDIVKLIKDRNEMIILPGPYRVLGVESFIDHQEVALDKIS